MKKPSIAELLQASGYATYPPELVQRAMSALYGNIGANLDARNWASILLSAFCGDRKHVLRTCLKSCLM